MPERRTGLFDDPLAEFVRQAFEAAVRDGQSAYAAAENIVAEHAAVINDPDSAPAIYYALAELQLQHGVISTKIRKRALTLINSGDGLERWRSEPPDVFDARNKVEQDLRTRLVEMG